MNGGGKATRKLTEAMAPRWRHPAVLLTLALGAMLAAQVGWLVLNQRSFEWDAAWYMEVAVLLRRTLLEDGLTAFLDRVRAAFGVKAPGVSVAAALAMAVVGESPGRAVAVSLAAWLLATVYLYLLARRFLSSEASALAALLAAASPIAYSLSRSLLTEATLAAAAVAFLFHAAASERLSRRGHLVALAAWGAAGIMVKVTFPVYVVVPALLLTLTPWREARPRLGRMLLAWTLVATAAVGVAAWLWYAANWRNMIAFIRSAGYGPAATNYVVAIPSFAAWTLVHAASPWTVLSLVALLAIASVRGLRTEARPPLLLALAWMVPPLAMVLSTSNRQGRYLAASLPALALAVAALVEPWLRRSARTAALTVAILAGPPLAYFIGTTVPTPLMEPIRAFVQAGPFGGNQYEEPPDLGPSPSSGIIAAATRATGDGRPAMLLLNVDLPELNHNNLKVEALLQRSPVVPAQIDQSSPDGAIATALEGDLLLLQTGGKVTSDFLNVQGAEVARELATGRHAYREVASFDLPPGRRVTLLARRCAIEIEPVSGAPLATLERGLELLSLDVARSTPGLLSVRTRYRARGGSHPMLAVLVQVARPDGQVLGRQEHRLCRRPQRPWPAGSVIEDTFLLPAAAAAPGLGLRMGLRDLISGRPLRVETVSAGLGSPDGEVVAFPRLAERISVPAAP